MLTITTGGKLARRSKTTTPTPTKSNPISESSTGFVIHLHWAEERPGFRVRRSSGAFDASTAPESARGQAAPEMLTLGWPAPALTSAAFRSTAEAFGCPDRPLERAGRG